MAQQRIRLGGKRGDCRAAVPQEEADCLAEWAAVVDWEQPLDGAAFGDTGDWAARFCRNAELAIEYYSQSSEESNARSNDLGCARSRLSFLRC